MLKCSCRIRDADEHLDSAPKLSRFCCTGSGGNKAVILCSTEISKNQIIQIVVFFFTCFLSHHRYATDQFLLYLSNETGTRTFLKYFVTILLTYLPQFYFCG